MLTDAEIAKLKELCEKATKGPWQTRFIFRALQSARKHAKDDDVLYMTPPDGDYPDADFIAASRDALPRLIEERERMQIKLGLLEASRPAFRGGVCAYCGETFTGEDVDKVSAAFVDHVLTCKKHPLAAALDENVRLKMSEEMGWDERQTLTAQVTAAKQLPRGVFVTDCAYHWAMKVIEDAAACKPKITANPSLTDPIWDARNSIEPGDKS